MANPNSAPTPPNPGYNPYGPAGPGNVPPHPYGAGGAGYPFNQPPMPQYGPAFASQAPNPNAGPQPFNPNAAPQPPQPPKARLIGKIATATSGALKKGGASLRKGGANLGEITRELLVDDMKDIGNPAKNLGEGIKQGYGELRMAGRGLVRVARGSRARQQERKEAQHTKAAQTIEDFLSTGTPRELTSKLEGAKNPEALKRLGLPKKEVDRIHRRNTGHRKAAMAQINGDHYDGMYIPGGIGHFNPANMVRRTKQGARNRVNASIAQQEYVQQRRTGATPEDAARHATERQQARRTYDTTGYAPEGHQETVFGPRYVGEVGRPVHHPYENALDRITRPGTRPRVIDEVILQPGIPKGSTDPAYPYQKPQEIAAVDPSGRPILEIARNDHVNYLEERGQRYEDKADRADRKARAQRRAVDRTRQADDIFIGKQDAKNRKALLNAKARPTSSHRVVRVARKLDVAQNRHRPIRRGEKHVHGHRVNPRP